MNNRQKKRAIKDLEQDRQRDIRQIYGNYNNRKQYQRGEKHNNRHKDYDRNNRYSNKGVREGLLYCQTSPLSIKPEGLQLK